jgi:hypothetical protein
VWNVRGRGSAEVLHEITTTRDRLRLAGIPRLPEGWKEPGCSWMITRRGDGNKDLVGDERNNN